MNKCFCYFNGYEVKDAKARPYNTITEMKSNPNLVSGDIVRTIGYYSANDGGGATYLIRDKKTSDIEDLGSIHFIGESLVAELINDDVNIKQFGAKGDKSNDDTECFKNAIKYLKTKKQCLNLNAGDYIVSSTIELPFYVKLITMGNVSIKYTGVGSLFHLYNDSELVNMKGDYQQNPYNIGNVLDGSKGVLILEGLGIESEQVGLTIGETTLGSNHVTHSAWCNFTNVYIEKFKKGIFFTNIQNYIQRFYNIVISYCDIGISNSDLDCINSGELITFDKCSINNNNLGVQINNILAFNFVNCSIDYNRNGIELNWQGYYTLNLINCWLEGNNEYLSNDTFLLKSNVPTINPHVDAYSLPIVNLTNCLIYPKNKCAWTSIVGKMKLNINNCTIQVNMNNGNNAEGEFLCDDEVKIISCNGLSFVEGAMLLNKGSIINKNSDFSLGDTTGYDFTGNEWGNDCEVSTTHFHSGSKSLKITGGGSKYVDFVTEKFNISRFKKLMGSILLYIDSTNSSEKINITLDLKFYDKEGNELTDEKITMNRDYTYSTLQKFVVVPKLIANNNDYIDIPNNAMSGCLHIVIGNINNDIYIDNISIMGI